jgi:hypothetical protein
MQGPNSSSTLELVVNEQQMQNMSQIDLSRISDHQPRQNNLQQDGQATSSGNSFGLNELKQWPIRFRDNLNEKLDEAKAKSETRTQYCMEIIQAFSGLIIWFLCFIFTIIIPVILFFIGLTNLDACPDLPSLPYLVFAIGFVMTASNLFNLALSIDLKILTNHSQLTIDIKNTIASILNIIFNCIVTFLYILTAYKILVSSKAKQNDQGSANGNNESIQFECDETLTSFTYWFIITTLGSMLTLSLVGAILFAYTRYRLAIIRGSTPRSQTGLSTNGFPQNQLNTNPQATPTNRV